MEVFIHWPTNRAQMKQIEKKTAVILSESIAACIEELPISIEKKLRLIDELILTISKDTE